MRSVADVAGSHVDLIGHEIDLWVRDCCRGEDRNIFGLVEDIVMASASDQYCSIECSLCSIIRSIEKAEGWCATVSGRSIRRSCRPIELRDLLSGTLIQVQHLNGNARRLKDGIKAGLQSNVVYLHGIWFDVGAAILVDSHGLGVGDKVIRMSLHPGASDQLEEVSFLFNEARPISATHPEMHDDSVADVRVVEAGQKCSPTVIVGGSTGDLLE